MSPSIRWHVTHEKDKKKSGWPWGRLSKMQPAKTWMWFLWVIHILQCYISAGESFRYGYYAVCSFYYEKNHLRHESFILYCIKIISKLIPSPPSESPLYHCWMNDRKGPETRPHMMPRSIGASFFLAQSIILFRRKNAKKAATAMIGLNEFRVSAQEFPLTT